MASISVINISDMDENKKLDEVMEFTEDEVEVKHSADHSTLKLDSANLDLTFDSNQGKLFVSTKPGSNGA